MRNNPDFQVSIALGEKKTVERIYILAGTGNRNNYRKKETVEGII
jgi:hypothetical protein